MTRTRQVDEVEPKPLVWLRGEVKSPPFSLQARQETGMLLRLMQNGETLGMPYAEHLPDVGPRCGALRIRDGEHNWRLMYRLDSDAVVIVEVYSKKSRRIPQAVIDRCKRRLAQYDQAAQRMKNPKNP